jgi:hypothetical protein
MEDWYLIIKKTGGDFLKISKPNGVYFADPFLVKVKDEMWVFFEVWDWKIGLGYIACCKIDIVDGLLIQGPLVTVLKETWHLSYPFLINFSGKLFMIPESGTTGCVYLYECVDFPTVWTKKILLKGLLEPVDSTVTFYKDKYWIFISVHNDVKGLKENGILTSSILTI